MSKEVLGAIFIVLSLPITLLATIFVVWRTFKSGLSMPNVYEVWGYGNIYEHKKTSGKTWFFLLLFAYAYWYLLINILLKKQDVLSYALSNENRLIVIIFFILPFMWTLIPFYIDWVADDMRSRNLNPNTWLIPTMHYRPASLKKMEFLIRYIFLRNKFPIKHKDKIKRIKLKNLVAPILLWLACATAITLTVNQLIQ